MPPDRSTYKIDRLLKAFAKRRREQAGGTFELDGPTRNILQAEVARMVPVRREKEARASLITRILFGGAVAASAVICALIVFKREPAATPPGEQDKVSNYVITPGAVNRPEALPLGAPIAANQTPAGLRLAGGLRLTGSAEITADAAKEEDYDLGTFTLDAPAEQTGSDNVVGLNGGGFNVSGSGANYKIIAGDGASGMVGGGATLSGLAGSSPPNGANSTIGGNMAFTPTAVPSAVQPPGVEDGLASRSVSETSARNAENVREKLNNIIIPTLNFRDATVREVIDFLRQKSVELDATETDPARKGVNIVIKTEAPAMLDGESDVPAMASGTPGLIVTSSLSRPVAVPAFGATSAAGAGNAPALAAPAAAAPEAPGEERITLSLSNIPLSEALRYVTDLAGMKYITGAGGVAIVPLSESTDVLVTKTYDVPPGFLQQIGSDGNPRAFLENAGVPFPPGSAANYLAAENKLAVRNTGENLGLVDKILGGVGPGDYASLRDTSADANADIRKTEKLDDVLDRLIVPKIEFHDAALRDVIGYLRRIGPGPQAGEAERARNEGLNFVLKSKSNPRISLSLEHAPMSEVLRKVAAQAGMEVRVDPYAIVFAPAEPGAELITREYTVPQELALKLTSGGGKGGGAAAAMQPVMRPETAKAIESKENWSGVAAFLRQSGVEFPEGATASYFPDTGKLVVRDTGANLALVDRIVQTSVEEQDEQQMAEAKEMEVNKALIVMGKKISAPDVVLATFQIELKGDIVRLIDADGSIYTGKIEQPALQKELDAFNGRTFTNVAANGESAGEHNQTVRAAPQQQEKLQQQNYAGVTAAITNSATFNGATVMQTAPQQSFSFRAAGLNRKLNQQVVFEGNYIASAAEGAEQKATLDKAAAAGKEAKDAEISDLQKELPPPPAAARIQGQAQIGDGGTVNVDAVVVPLKAKAAR